MRTQFFVSVCFLILSLAISACVQTDSFESQEKNPSDKIGKPNVIIVYVDDLGFGDVGVNGAVGAATPHIDGLAARGVNFTDAHASSATCTPSRYSLLTGEYAFRRAGKVLPGDAPALIRPGKPTLASMLKQEGYTTGVVGKWHLGLGDGNLDWNSKIAPGPKEIGFDYSFLIPATGDRVPTVYVEDGSVINLNKDDPIAVRYGKELPNDRPTGKERPDLLSVGADPVHSGAIVNSVSRIGYMRGGESALWDDLSMPDVLNEKALSFISENRENPFFLYYSYHDIHVPRLPNPRFVGASTMGPRGDAIVQMDWMTGQVLEKLERLGIDDETIVIFTSDNGPVLNDGYADRAEELLGKHKPGGDYRGGKYSAFEAGARVPFIISWPKTMLPRETSATVSQVDIFASLAAVLNHELEANEAIDSLDFSSTLFGESDEGRSILFKEAARTVSIRIGDFKYIEELSELPNRSIWFRKKNIETGVSTTPQLYDLSVDPGESNNIAGERLNLVEEAKTELKKLRLRTERE